MYGGSHCPNEWAEAVVTAYTRGWLVKECKIRDLRAEVGDEKREAEVQALVQDVVG